MARSSRVSNRCTTAPTQTARTVSSGEKETCDTPRMGVRQKASAGTICSCASFSLRDSVTSARSAVGMAHRPAWSAKHVRPYRLDAATSLAYPGGGGKEAASPGRENPTVPSELKTRPPFSDSATAVALITEVYARDALARDLPDPEGSSTSRGSTRSRALLK